ncbi:ureidoglycolate lyase [Achromobacter spanius]|uniref:ureidoglycolate lyase n=1 Tax=Achromobacter spanius TaxID=217203 RepID=UPI00320B2225
MNARLQMPPSHLPLAELTAETFAPYGTIIASAGRDGREINAGTTLRVDMPEPDILKQGGRPSLSVFRATPGSLPFEVRMMERHRLGSQTFVPLMGTPFVVLVALGATEPDLSTLKAFRADGSAGITLAPDVWHHPLLALAAGDFVVLERKGETVDCEIVDMRAGIWLVESA